MKVVGLALVFADLCAVVPRASAGQPVSVLHIRVALVDAEQKVASVPRHVLLVSDNRPGVRQEHYETNPRRHATL